MAISGTTSRAPYQLVKALQLFDCQVPVEFNYVYLIAGELECLDKDDRVPVY